jgi:hypothetical protein
MRDVKSAIVLDWPNWVTAQHWCKVQTQETIDNVDVILLLLQILKHSDVMMLPFP